MFRKVVHLPPSVRTVSYTHLTVVVLTDREGKDIPVNMIQKWPVKKAMTHYKEKPRPYTLLETGVRVIDTVNPIVEDVYKRQLIRCEGFTAYQVLTNSECASVLPQE